MWARGAVLALLLCGACVDGRSVGYPDELPEGTRALLLRVDLDGLGWAMFLRPDAPPTSIAVPTEGDLWMLALPFTPTDLLLEWEVPLRDVGASGGAALPPPLASFRRAPDEPWVQAEPPARPFFLPHVTFAACSAVGGCLTESDGLIQCLEPCPIPTVTPPAPPSRACPEGWGSRELEDAVFCAPPHEARAACGEGERQPVGGEACASVSTCAAGPWPDAEGGERGWYVRGGAVGGDGTPLDPYGTLAEAVAAARDGDQILLGAGTIPP
ncbi:MAG: hypothetical protein KC933_41115, partial [Myxococcales bacterium]|nr:hypothetical protein [Myxococcales bacterium]